MTTSTAGGVATTYTYDARNKMVGYSSGSVVAAYVYDDAGNRVQETVNGVTTDYLTDTQNPTGYAQALEAKSSPTATPSMTYFLGGRVFAQAGGSGTVTYLLPDAHGSTSQLANSGGTVTAAFRYDAFGTALNFTPTSAGTVFLFGGDAVYDPASGLYLHGNGVRPTNGFLFIQRDSGGYGDNQDPANLHAYLYAAADPISGDDPTGHFLLLSTLGAVATGVGEYAQDLGTGLIGAGQAGFLVSSIAYVEASICEGLMQSSGNTEGAGAFDKIRSIAYEGMVGSAALMTGGAALSMVGDALVLGGTALSAVGAVQDEGVLANARFAQTTYSEAFSTAKNSLFRGKTINDVVNELESHDLSPAEVPIEYIERDGNTLILNTRSAQALTRAGIPRSQWNAINVTGDPDAEARLDGQLQRNGLTSQGTSTVTSTG